MLLFPATYGHNSFALNGHLNADGSINQASIESSVILDSRRIRSGVRDVRDPLHLAQGGTLGRVHKGMTVVQLAGRIVVPKGTGQAAAISDKERAMLAAFDPYQCYLDSPSTDGAYAFDFSEPTADLANYSTGRIPLRYYARPADKPVIDEKLNDRGHRPFNLALIAADPRQYEQTESSVSLTPGSPGQTLRNAGNTPGPIKVTITMTGAGNAAFNLNRGAYNLTLNLSGTVNLDVIVIVMETCGPYGRGRLITKNAVENFALKTSAAATSWIPFFVGTTSYTISNTTNVGTCVVAGYSSRV